MLPLQRIHLLLLLLLLTLLVLCMPLGQAGGVEQVETTTHSPTSRAPAISLSAPCSSPSFLSLAMGLALLFFLRLR